MSSTPRARVRTRTPQLDDATNCVVQENAWIIQIFTIFERPYFIKTLYTK